MTSELTKEPAKTRKGSAKRSRDTIRMIRQETDGTITDALLPVGRGWNDGTPGSLFWNNLGWIPYDVYAAQKHSEEVAEKKKAGSNAK